MPNKQLPAIGDSNWGSTLNSYITQTTDNTLGGGFNSFTNFADRPNNLTADDKGKTYLNTQSGNFHKWDGTKWVVNHTGDSINVRDFGNITGVNDTTVVQSAIDYCQGNKISNTSRLFLPSGFYAFEVECQGQEAITIFGAGNGAFGSDTNVRAINPGGYCFTFHSAQHLENMSIAGYQDFSGAVSRYFNGVRTLPGIGPQNAGFNPVVLNNVHFSGCKISFYKEAALFGKFTNCNFTNCDIGVFSKGGGTLYSSIYSGFDKWDHCFWQGCNKACVVYSNPNNYDEGATRFDNCWFEGNKGITFLGIGTGLNKTLVFSSPWLESNTQLYGQTVNIDGIDYVVDEFILDHSRVTLEYSSLPFGITLKNSSYIRLDNVTASADGNNTFDKIKSDSTSYVDCRTIGGDGFAGVVSDFTADSSPLFYYDLGRNMNCYRSRNSKTMITRKFYNDIPYGSMALTIPPNIESSSTATAELVTDDGLYNNSCIKFTLPNAANSYTIGYESYSAPAKPFQAFSFSVKKSDSRNATLVVVGVGGRQNSIILKDNNWHTYTGISYASGYSNMQISNQNQYLNTDTPTTILLSKLQRVVFDTLQEATDYCKSDIYALPAENPITSHGRAIPSVGTYTKGDIIHNINPTAGGYAGWICTVAGTPGTWKGFGLIQV